MTALWLWEVAVCCMALAAASPPRGTIRSVDFRNFSFDWPADSDAGPTSWIWLGTSSPAQVRLRNGGHSFAGSGVPASGGPYIELRSVAYGDLTGDGEDEAAVDLLYGTGGSANWHYLYVYTLADSTPKLLGVLRSGSRADGGLAHVAIAKASLVVEFQDGDRREGDCCSRGIIRVEYRYQNGRFREVGEPQKDSLRVAVYPSMPKPGPLTVRQKVTGKTVNIVFTDASGVERLLTSSGVNTEPNLSSNNRSVVFLREVAGRRGEIWTVQSDGSGAKELYARPVRWSGMLCPSSSFRSPQWASDGRAVYFVTDCSPMTGALWRLDVSTRTVAPIVPDAVNYGVIQTGRFKGYLIANQRSVPSGPALEPSYPVYPFFLYRPDGTRMQQVGGETGDLDQLLASWENR